MTCSMYEYAKGECEEYKEESQKQNLFYLDQWFSRYGLHFDELSDLDKEYFKKSIVLQFYMKIAELARKDQFLSISQIWQVFNTTLMTGSPSSYVGFKDVSVKQTCVDDIGYFNFDPRCREWYIDANNSTRIEISEPFVQSQNNYVMAMMSRKILDENNEFLSVFTTYIEFGNFMEKILTRQDQSVSTFNAEGYNVLLHSKNGMVFFHKNWNAQDGLKMTWEEVEFPSTATYLENEESAFSAKTKQVLDACQETTFQFMSNEIDSRFSFEFSKNGEPYIATLFPVELVSMSNSFAQQSRNPLLIGRVQKDIHAKILEESIKFQEIHLYLSIIGFVFVGIVMIIAGFHLAAAMHLSIDIPIEILCAFLTYQDWNLQELHEIFSFPVKSSVYEPESALNIRRRTYTQLHFTNSPNSKPIQILKQQQQQQHMATSPRTGKNPSIGGNTIFASPAITASTFAAGTGGLIGLSVPPRLKLRDSVMKKSTDIKQFYQMRSTINSNDNLVASKRDSRIFSEVKTDTIGVTFDLINTNQNNLTTANYANINSNNYNNTISSPDHQRIRRTNISRQAPVEQQQQQQHYNQQGMDSSKKDDSSNDFMLKSEQIPRVVDLNEINTGFYEMNVIVNVFQKMENVIKLALSSDVTGETDHSLLCYSTLNQMYRISNNHSGMGRCYTSMGLLFLKKSAFSEAARSLEIAVEATIAAHIGQQCSVSEFEHEYEHGYVELSSQSASRIAQRLRYLALALFLQARYVSGTCKSQKTLHERNANIKQSKSHAKLAISITRRFFGKKAPETQLILLLLVEIELESSNYTTAIQLLEEIEDTGNNKFTTNENNNHQGNYIIQVNQQINSQTQTQFAQFDWISHYYAYLWTRITLNQQTEASTSQRLRAGLMLTAVIENCGGNQDAYLTKNALQLLSENINSIMKQPSEVRDQLQELIEQEHGNVFEDKKRFEFYFVINTDEDDEIIARYLGIIRLIYSSICEGTDTFTFLRFSCSSLSNSGCSSGENIVTAYKQGKGKEKEYFKNCLRDIAFRKNQSQEQQQQQSQQQQMFFGFSNLGEYEQDEFERNNRHSDREHVSSLVLQYLTEIMSSVGRGELFEENLNRETPKKQMEKKERVVILFDSVEKRMFNAEFVELVEKYEKDGVMSVMRLKLPDQQCNRSLIFEIDDILNGVTTVESADELVDVLRRKKGKRQEYSSIFLL